MPRLFQCCYVAGLFGLCWFGMQAVHELGHVIGAMLSGGQVQKVVLHPASISRTDVFPNPSPLIVVWAGPVFGCALPALVLLLPKKPVRIMNDLRFFSGFCLTANGGYLGFGSFEGIGDAGEILRLGTHHGFLVSVGAVLMISGLLVWHRLGSLWCFVAHPDRVPRIYAVGLLATAVLAAITEMLLSPRF